MPPSLPSPLDQPPSTELAAAVEFIRRTYRERDADPAILARWTPFSEAAVAGRNAQVETMATLLRTLGRSDLGGWRILDVGCGDGRLLRQFLDLGALPEDLSGVEIRDQAVEVSRRLSPHINVVLGTGVDLPFPDSTFDLVTQFVVFSSMPEPRLREQIAREIIRVLKPGGYIFWWDCRTTMIGRLRQPVDPRDLFPGLPVNGFFTAMRPPPSTCLRMPRVLRPLGRIADCLAFPRTHYAALIGPKPQDPPQ